MIGYNEVAVNRTSGQIYFRPYKYYGKGGRIKSIDSLEHFRNAFLRKEYQYLKMNNEIEFDKYMKVRYTKEEIEKIYNSDCYDILGEDRYGNRHILIISNYGYEKVKEMGIC